MVTINSFPLIFMLLWMHTVIASSITSTEPSNDLEQEIRQMRIELCASEIERNKITSALKKFSKFPDSDQVIKDIVKYYVENYNDKFDSFLVFLNEVESNVKQNAYQTLFELNDSNVVRVRDVLNIYSFIKQNQSENEISNQFYETIESAVIKMLIKSDLYEFESYANDNRTQEKFLNLIPLIVRVIYNNNHENIAKLLDLSKILTNFTQKIKLLHVVLKQAIPDNNIRHLSLIFHQIKAVRAEVYNNYEIRRRNICLVLSLENDIPKIFQPHFSYTLWNIKNVFNNEYLRWYESTKFQMEIVKTNSFNDPEYSTWRYNGTFFDNYSLIENRHSRYLQLDKCIHNDSFVRLNVLTSLQTASSALRSLWTIDVIDDELQLFQIKNSLTGEYLSVDNENGNNANDDVELNRVVLSKTANEKTKWLFEVVEMYPDFLLNDVDVDQCNF